MRINKYVANATGLSRRAADRLITGGQVKVNGESIELGYDVQPTDQVTLDGKVISRQDTKTILLNKPIGYVVSREGQGSQTIYDLLPAELQHLKPVGRLDKDSSGLLLLTNDGQLTQVLTHPSHQKDKVYQVELDKTLSAKDQATIEAGVRLDDGLSHLNLTGRGQTWTVTMHEGRNRQIRRTFEAAGYKVTKLHRTQFGECILEDLPQGKMKIISE